MLRVFLPETASKTFSRKSTFQNLKQRFVTIAHGLKIEDDCRIKKAKFVKHY